MTVRLTASEERLLRLEAPELALGEPLLKRDKTWRLAEYNLTAEEAEKVRGVFAAIWAEGIDNGSGDLSIAREGLRRLNATLGRA